MAHINLDFYNEKYVYSDGEVEKEIIEYVKKFNDSDYSEILNTDIRWPVFYHLSPIRQNVINWFDFKKDSSVLEIGAGMGAITPALCERCEHVVSVELSKTRATCIYERCKDYENLEIIVGNLNAIKFNQKFDYITLIGVFEYACSFTEGDTPHKTFLNRIKKLLKPNGKLIIAIENRFGLKYWCGAAEDHTGKPFYGIKGYDNTSHVRTFDKQTITDLLISEGLMSNDFYYPYPDYKLPQMIYSDKKRPNGLNTEKHNYYYDENAKLVASEENIFYEIAKNKVDDFLANSFIIVSSQEQDNSVKSSNIIFSNTRKKEYRVMTKILDNGTVIKNPMLEQANSHIKKIAENINFLKKMDVNILSGKLFNNTITFPFIDKKTLDFILVEMIESGEKTKAFSLVNDFYNEILKSSNSAKIDDFEQTYKLKHDDNIDFGTILSKGFIDLSYFNCFYDDEFLFFDQEWVFDNIPAKFILFRSISTFYLRNKFLSQYIRIDEFYSYFSISQEMLNVFYDLDSNYIGKSIISPATTYLNYHNYQDMDNFLINKENIRLNIEKEIKNDLFNFKAQIEELSNQNQKLICYNEELNSKLIRAESNFFSILNSRFWRFSKPLRRISGVNKKILKSNPITNNFFKGLLSLKRIGIKATLKKVNNKFKFKRVQKIKVKKLDLSKDERTLQQNTKFSKAIKFSVLVPLYNTPEKFLKEMIESVIAQTYSDWELCLADGSDSSHSFVGDICEKYASKDKRITYKKLGKNLGISENTNACIEMSTGDYIALFDHDDLLHPAALFENMKVICEKNADFIYSDEASFENSKRNIVLYNYKPDFAIDTLRAYNYICHLTVFKKELLAKTGHFRSECDGSQDYDIILRLTEQAENILHLPKILYFWRVHQNSVASNISAKMYTIDAAKKALSDHLDRVGVKGKVVDARVLSNYKIDYEISFKPLISILIPNKDNVDDLDKCLKSIFKKSTYKNYEIIIIENNSVEIHTFNYYELLREHENVKVVKWNGKFNYSAINNFGFSFCKGEHIILLNNDIEVISENWIEEMLMFSQRSDVGAVGAKLYYPDDTIQHGGIILGIGGVGGHSHKYFDRQDYGYMSRLCISQNLSAVTAACMMVPRHVFEEVNGFDESFEVAFNDVDLCMRIRKAEYNIVWTPYAELYHYESKSRGLEDTPEKKKRFEGEVLRFKARWKEELKAGDPYYNPNMTLDREDFSLKD